MEKSLRSPGDFVPVGSDRVAQQSVQGRLQFRLQKTIAKCFQFCREDALAGEQQRLGHFAQQET